MTETTSIPHTPGTAAPARPPRRVLAGGTIAAAVIAVVLLGWLMWPSPPGPVVLHTGTSHYVVTTTVHSARAGTTDIEIDLTNRTGGPVDRATVEVEAIMPLMGHAAAPISADSVGNGRYRVAQVPLMMTGPWQLQVSINAPDGADNLILPIPVSG
jgi:hypothetical protein